MILEVKGCLITNKHAPIAIGLLHKGHIFIYALWDAFLIANKVLYVMKGLIASAEYLFADMISERKSSLIVWLISFAFG